MHDRSLSFSKSLAKSLICRLFQLIGDITRQSSMQSLQYVWKYMSPLAGFCFKDFLWHSELDETMLWIFGVPKSRFSDSNLFVLMFCKLSLHPIVCSLIWDWEFGWIADIKLSLLCTFLQQVTYVFDSMLLAAIMKFYCNWGRRIEEIFDQTLHFSTTNQFYLATCILKFISSCTYKFFHYFIFWYENLSGKAISQHI